MQEERIALFHHHQLHHRNPQENGVMDIKSEYEGAHNLEGKPEFEEEFGVFDANAMLEDHHSHIEGHHPHIEGHHPHIEGHHPHIEGHHPHIEGHHPHIEEHDSHMQGHNSHIQVHQHIQGHHTHIHGNHSHMDVHHHSHIDGHDSHIERHHPHIQGHDAHIQGPHSYIEGHHPHIEEHDTHIDGHHHPHLEGDLDGHNHSHLEDEIDGHNHSHLQGDLDGHLHSHLEGGIDGHHHSQLLEMTQLEEEEDLEDTKVKKEEEGALVVDQAIVVVTKNAQRRLWKKDRSQAWWDRCNEPDFPEPEFHQAFRMSKATFDHLCEEIGHAVAKEDTMLRQAIPVRQRVAVCIWRLASGEPLRLLSKRFGLGISTCHKLVIEVCTAINDVLLPKYICWPSHEHSQAIREDFERITGIPDVVGAIYTTHMPIIAPKVNVTSYFNRSHTERTQKTSYSLTLQGVVDAHGLFTDVCIGWPGSFSDELVLEKSALYERGLAGFFQNDWIVGGPSSPPLDWLLTPYVDGHLTWAQHAFNERIEEALKVARSAFSRLKGRWQYLTKRAEIKVQELPTILGACCVLHNLCEKLDEPFDPDLYMIIQDDLTVCEHLPWSRMSLERRDQIAHNLMHSMHSGMASL